LAHCGRIRDFDHCEVAPLTSFEASEPQSFLELFLAAFTTYETQSPMNRKPFAAAGGIVQERRVELSGWMLFGQNSCLSHGVDSRSPPSRQTRSVATNLGLFSSALQTPQGANHDDPLFLFV
jgi:hypothetical protein